MNKLFSNLFKTDRTVLLHSFFFLFILTWTSWACQGNKSDAGSMRSDKHSGLEVVEKSDTYGNIERYSRRTSDYAKQGVYQLIAPNGDILESAHYQNDTLHGIRVLYYETGDTQIIEHYQHGRFEGPYQAYYEGGALELEGVYTANAMEGSWKRYYENGQLMEEVQFQDNQENGPFIEYHPNGKIKAEGYYKEGDNEHGLLKLYDEQGELTKTMNCENGVCRTVWKKGGT